MRVTYRSAFFPTLRPNTPSDPSKLAILHIMASPKQSQALAKREHDTSFMPPPPPPKRIKRPAKVLDEDVYTDALSRIIARDFFPGLLESQAQQEYIDALDSDNKDWIREAGHKLRQVMTPGPGTRGRRGTSMTPAMPARGERTPRYTGQTPIGTPGYSVRSTPLAEQMETRHPTAVETELSLGAFQAKYTSEDNESFNALLDRQNAARAKKYAFLHSGNTIPSPRQIAHREREQKLLAASSSTALIPRPSEDLDARPASIASFPSKQGARNSFMFSPNSIEDTHATVAQAAQDRSLAPPKAVSYAATRLPNPNADNITSAPPASPSLSAVDAAIAGRPYASSTEPGYSGAETPRVNGYAFVDAEPTPSELGIPVSDDVADAAEREATMALLPSVSADEARNPFVLQQASKREELHHRMVDKSNLGRRKGNNNRLDELRGGEEGKEAGRTPTPRFGSFTPGGSMGQKVGNLTPAARMLASRIGGTPGRDGGLFGGGKKGAGGERRAWTPTPVLKGKKRGRME